MPRRQGHLRRAFVLLAIATVSALVGTIPAAAAVASTASRGQPAGTFVAALPGTGVAMLQLIEVRGSLAGTYQAAGMHAGRPVRVAFDQCGVAGTVSDNHLLLHLSNCSEATSDGTLYGTFTPTGIDIDVRSKNGNQAVVHFKRSSVAAYNKGLARTRLTAEEWNKLDTYVGYQQRTKSPFFQPTAGALEVVDGNTVDVVTYQNNAVSDHAGATDVAEVIDWVDGEWIHVAIFPLSSNTGPIPGTPTAISVHGLTGYAIPLTWQAFVGWRVIAATGAHWHSLALPSDPKLGYRFLSDASASIRSGGPTTLVETLHGCVGGNAPCGSVTVTYLWHAANESFSLKATRTSSPALLG